MSNVTDKIVSYMEAKKSYDKFQKLSQKDNVDKGLGFNLGNKFSSLKFTLSLDNWIGYSDAYADLRDSSCTKILQLDDYFKDIFIKYLNTHIEEIMEAVLDDMKKDVKSTIKDKIKNLEAEIQELKDFAK